CGCSPGRRSPGGQSSPNPLSPGTNDVRCGLTETATVIRPLFVILLCALASSQATAQNKASQMLLSLSEDQRNAAVTRGARGAMSSGTRLSARYLTPVNWGWAGERRYLAIKIRTR